MLSDLSKQGVVGQEPVDAVITWVDGADPKHKQKLDAHLGQIRGPRPPSANPTRFNDAGEIDYCVVSLLKFAPWIRTIFIVTDQQRPGLMQKIIGTVYEHRIQVVDHLAIFKGYEDCLPTFNSSSILPMLWRVPGLSEKFLFLNDDFSLLRPVAPRDFFRDDKVVLRGAWYSLSERVWYKKLAKSIQTSFQSIGKKDVPRRVGFVPGQELSAKLVGFKDKCFRLPHNPHPWRVSTLAGFFAEHPDVLQNTIKFRLRSAEQFIGESLAAHLELSRGSAIVDNRLKTIQIKPNTRLTIKLKLRLSWADWNKRYAFACVQSLERGTRENQAMVIKWLRQRVGDPDAFWQSNKSL